jgi:hypothetical protein
MMDEVVESRESAVVNNKMEQDRLQSFTKLNICKRREIDQERKHYEAQYLRDIIAESTETMRRLQDNEIEAIRQVNRLNSTMLDESTSSIVEIPSVLQQRLKEAKR